MFVRTTLDIDDDVLGLARALAQAEGRSIGLVLSDLARRGAAPGRVDAAGDRPVIRVPAGAAALTPDMVRAANDEA